FLPNTRAPAMSLSRRSGKATREWEAQASQMGEAQSPLSASKEMPLPKWEAMIAGASRSGTRTGAEGGENRRLTFNSQAPSVVSGGRRKSQDSIPAISPAISKRELTDSSRLNDPPIR